MFTGKVSERSVFLGPRLNLALLLCVDLGAIPWKPEMVCCS